MYFGTPPIIKNGLITYLDAANYLSFTGSISGSYQLLTEVTTFVSSSSVTFVLSESISESYVEIISESSTFITSSSIIGYETSQSIVGYTTSSSVIGQTTEVTSYTVTNNGTSYVFNGTASNPTIPLIRGTEYTFDISSSEHPFWFKSSPVTGSGSSAYNDGVSANGVTEDIVIWTVSSSAPSTLYYISEYSESLQGTFSISDGPFIGEDIISESYEPIISESQEPIISESYEEVISQSITYITESTTIGTIIEVTSSFLVPSQSISASTVLTTASWIDISGNKNSGSFILDPLFVNDNGGYFQFNGNSSTVILPHNTSSYDFTDNVTISGWVKINSFVTEKAFFSKYVSGSAGFEFLIRNDRKIHFEGANSTETFSLSSSISASTDTWYNVTGVKQGTDVRLYLNGLNVGSLSLTGSGNISNTQDISLASRSSGELFFGGVVANFFLYNRVLTDGEILQNYKALVTRYF